MYRSSNFLSVQLCHIILPPVQLHKSLQPDQWQTQTSHLMFSLNEQLISPLLCDSTTGQVLVA